MADGVMRMIGQAELRFYRSCKFVNGHDCRDDDSAWNYDVVYCDENVSESKWKDTIEIQRVTKIKML